MVDAGAGHLRRTRRRGPARPGAVKPSDLYHHARHGLATLFDCVLEMTPLADYVAGPEHVEELPIDAAVDPLDAPKAWGDYGLANHAGRSDEAAPASLGGIGQIEEEGVLAAHPIAVVPDIVRRYLYGGPGAPVVHAPEPPGIGQAFIGKAGGLGRHGRRLVL